MKGKHIKGRRREKYFFMMDEIKIISNEELRYSNIRFCRIEINGKYHTLRPIRIKMRYKDLWGLTGCRFERDRLRIKGVDTNSHSFNEDRKSVV